MQILLPPHKVAPTSKSATNSKLNQVLLEKACSPVRTRLCRYCLFAMQLAITSSRKVCLVQCYYRPRMQTPSCPSPHSSMPFPRAQLLSARTPASLSVGLHSSLSPPVSTQSQGCPVPDAESGTLLHFTRLRSPDWNARTTLQSTTQPPAIFSAP